MREQKNKFFSTEEVRPFKKKRKITSSLSALRALLENRQPIHVRFRFNFSLLLFFFSLDDDDARKKTGFIERFRDVFSKVFEVKLFPREKAGRSV